MTIQKRGKKGRENCRCATTKTPSLCYRGGEGKRRAETFKKKKKKERDLLGVW